MKRSVWFRSNSRSQIAAELTVEELLCVALLMGQFCVWLVGFVLRAVTVSEPYQSLREMYLIKNKGYSLKNLGRNL